jgi:fibro-slime domain-containing protein
VQGWFHDFWFTHEARYLFTAGASFSLQFGSTSDLFVYINGILVVDLGGIHQRLPARVDVSASGMATITEGGSLNAAGTMILPCPSAHPYTGQTFNAMTNTDGQGRMNCTIAGCDCRTRVIDLGIQSGRTYEIAVFGANRHPIYSDYEISLSGFSTNRSSCVPRCGDGAQTGSEQCDCGDRAANASTDVSCAGRLNDGSYGGCTAQCRFGPYCGDGTVDPAALEECDLGTRGNNATYGMTTGCAPGCRYPHFCGDAWLDEAEGEQCDLGPNNGMPDVPCSASCRLVP